MDTSTSSSPTGIMPRSVEPENEIHSVEEEQKQKSNEEKQQESDEEPQDDVQHSAFNFELGSQFTWSEDDHSEMDGFSISAIHDSVVAIRKEASTFDAVLAVDQLDTLKAEVAMLKRELSARTEEIDELRELASLKDARIGTLELEIDLYRAESCNQKDGLQECISTMTTFDSESEPGSQQTKENQSSVVRSKKGQCSVEELPNVLTDETNSTCTEISKDDSSSKVSSDVAVVPQARAPRPLDPPSCASSVQSSSSSSIATTATRSAPLGRRSVLFPIQEKPKFSTEHSRKLTSANNPQRRSRGRSFPFCRSSCQKEHQRKHVIVNNAVVEEEEDPVNEIALEMEQMGHRMHAAIATSEELRRRLAVLNRYYEGTIRQLHTQLVEAKTDRDQVEFDLSRQISIMDRERREALEKVASVARGKKKNRKRVVKVVV